MLSTLSAIVVALAAAVSPANAAISHTQASPPLTANWPGPGTLAEAACLLSVTWTISVAVATRRIPGRSTRPDDASGG